MPGITVTRGLDAADAPNGYVWSVYFDSPELDNTNVDLLLVNGTSNLNVHGDKCRPLNVTMGEFVSVETIVEGDAQGGRFRSFSHTCGPAVDHHCPPATHVPIVAAPGSGSAYGSTSASEPPAYFAGGDGTQPFDVYKVTGLRYTVRFDSNLGDLPLLGVDSSRLFGSAPTVETLVPGVLPSETVLGDLRTGLAVASRVTTSSRFQTVGYGNSSETYSVAIPGGVPPAPQGLDVALALHVDEVQEVVIGAKHIDEVQVVTTSSDQVAEVQLVSMVGDEGTIVKGNFALFFPEVQLVTLASRNAVTNGTYRFTVSHFEANATEGGLIEVAENTTCVPWHATPSVIKNALENTDFIGKNGVEVTRSGDGTEYSSGLAGSAVTPFGYEYAVTFVGLNVYGNVPQLRVTSQGCPLRDVTTPGGPSSVTVTTPEAPVGGPIGSDITWKRKYLSGVGTGTEIQRVKVAAGSPLTSGTGSYHLNFSFGGSQHATGCIPWSATAQDVEAALELLPNIDSVLVERYGSGEALDDYGFTYSVFFDGNALRPVAAYADLGVNETASDDVTRPGLLQVDFTGCSRFATTIDDVVTPLANLTQRASSVGKLGVLGPEGAYSVQVARIQAAGLDLPAHSSAAAVKQELDWLSPIVDAPMHAAVSVPDDQDGLAWTLTYGSNDGNVPQVACVTDASFPAATSQCLTTTLVDGNTLGGTFLLDGSKAFAYNVGASEMATEVSTLAGLGSDVHVTRTPMDNRGGFSWTITFRNALGDAPLLTPSSSLTGTGASLHVEEVQKGNQLRGNFALSLNGHTTEFIPYDATPAMIKAALESLDSCGSVAVSASDHGAVGTEGGRGWVITFHDVVNPGDVPMLVPVGTDMLTGEGAAVLVMELTKGAEASGAEAKVSFDAPPYCSHTPTRPGVCGDPVNSFLLEWDSEATFGSSNLDNTVLDSPDLLRRVQRVVTESAPYDAIYSRGNDGENGDSDEWSSGYTSMAGTFQLSYGGVPTEALPAHATATQVRHALEALPGVGTVKVSRNYAPARVALPGTVDLLYGSSFVQCGNATLSAGSECGILEGRIQACDLVQLQGKWYRARDMWTNADGSQPRLSLGRADDCSVRTSYDGPTMHDATDAYAWGGGYEWSVTFLSVGAGDAAAAAADGQRTTAAVPELIGAPAHDLWPRASVLHVRGRDCEGCAYLPRGSSSAHSSNGLSLGLEYFVRVSARNSHGSSSAASPRSIVPNAVPASPEAASLAVVSGTELEVFWCPPSFSAGDVEEYEVQWDSSNVFENVTQNPLVGCSGTAKTGTDYGACSITGSAITGPCPYSFLITGLTEGKPYYVRVAGRNAVPVQTVLPLELQTTKSLAVDNTKWSGILRAVPLLLPPSPPRSVTLVNLDGNRLQVQVMPPLRFGGGNLTTCEIDVDTELSFQTLSAQTFTFEMDTIRYLHDEDDAPLMLEVDGLTPGVFYFVRVRILSTVGASLNTPALNHPMAPTQRSQPPVTASATPVEPTALAPSTEISVVWEEPPLSNGGDGGTALTGYLVEWWESHSVREEVQAVRLSWSAGETPTQTWWLRYMGEQTNGLMADTSAANVRDALMALHDGVSANTSGFLLGPLDVSRSTVNGDEGYVFSVTFRDDSSSATPGIGGKNNGDIPVLPVEDIFTSGSVQSYEVVSGIRASGVDEVQVITSYGTGEGQRNPPSGNFDDAVVRGHWRIAFGGSAFSAYLSTEANETEVEAAIESLPSTGDVSVSRESRNNSYTQGGNHGYRWLVTFHTPVGDRAPLVLDTQYVRSTNGDAGFTVQDGDNEVDHLGLLTCDGCVVGEEAVNYKSVLVSNPDARAYTIQGLTPGTAYKVTVSAVNVHGQGIRQPCNNGHDVIPPVVVPGLPTDALVNVNPGEADSLLVHYQPPVSDGGAVVTHYRVELDPATTTDYRDPTTTFQSPIAEVFRCASHPTRSVWTITTSSGNTTLDGGHFALQLTRGGSDLKTDAIPFDAPALAIEEMPNSEREKSEVYCENADGNANLAYCPNSRLVNSGSVQSKIQALESLKGSGASGVGVSRRSLGSGAYVWSVTFLDAGDDFELTPIDAGLDGTDSTLTGLVPGTSKRITLTGADAAASVTTAKVQRGVVHGACTGSLAMPSVGGLVTGQYYYARVFAYNQQGYGDPQTALMPEKPMVVPGRPTGVALEVYSADALKILFHPPTDDGGDAVDSYLVEYATDPTYTTGVGNVSVVMLSAGAPYYRVLPNLQTGVDYYVRVYAHNSQGFGLPQASSPTFEHPHVEPNPPAKVTLGVTSDTMLTVGFDYPESDGGDNLTHFRVEWDTSPSFSSLSSHPDKGSAVISADTERAFTIEYLTTYKSYYVRVTGRNGAGWGQPRLSSPISAAPALQVPGYPVSVAATPGTHDGYLNVRFDAPRLPRHGIQCGGLNAGALAATCPTPMGGTENAANGGAEITAYKVEWSIDPAFSSAEYDAGATELPAGDGSNGAHAYTARNLTIGNLYYVRVAARNIMGYSAFCSHVGGWCDSSGTRASALSTNSTSWNA